jgi:hypothetical protein
MGGEGGLEVPTRYLVKHLSGADVDIVKHEHMKIKYLTM